jgi:hypothetical protein
MKVSVWSGTIVGVVLLLAAGALSAQQTGESSTDKATSRGPDQIRTDDAPTDVLSPDEWRRVDAAVERALNFLATQQQRDGSFLTLDIGQPGVTSLCLMAFMSHGHLPGNGPYAASLEQATDYVLDCQKPNGLVTLLGPEGPQISRAVAHEMGVSAAYNHAISSLALSEIYGTTDRSKAERLQSVIQRSIRATLEMQRWPKDRDVDRGGWRYLNDFNREDSDLSITGWQLKFLRSARNAGFDVPKKSIDDAVAYVRRTFSDRYGAFGYAVGDYYDFRSRGMAGAGILALAHAGQHGAPEARRSGEWILRNGFEEYNTINPFLQSYSNDRYHYGLFNCCQGMYQLGGRYWQEFFPRVVKTLLANQQADGSWPAESHFNDGKFGNAYTTALVLLTLGAPNQLLPIYQR